MLWYASVITIVVSFFVGYAIGKATRQWNR